MFTLEIHRDDKYFQKNLRTIVTRSYEVRSITIRYQIEDGKISVFDIQDPGAMVIDRDFDLVRVGAQWFMISKIVSMDIMFDFNATRYPKGRRGQTGIALSSYIRDYLVDTLGLRHEIALVHAQNIDREVKSYDWVELFNGTTFSLSQRYDK